MKVKGYMVPQFCDLFCIVVKDDGGIDIGYEIGREGARFVPLDKFLEDECCCVSVERGCNDGEER